MQIMVKAILAAVIAFTVSTATAADLDKGVAALKVGDFATALTELRPLAEQGNATAQYNLGWM